MKPMKKCNVARCPFAQHLRAEYRKREEGVDSMRAQVVRDPDKSGYFFAMLAVLLGKKEELEHLAKKSGIIL